MSPVCILVVIALVAAVWSLFTPSRPPLAVAVVLLGIAMLFSCLH
jgi:hypothetical protein